LFKLKVQKFEDRNWTCGEMSETTAGCSTLQIGVVVFVLIPFPQEMQLRGQRCKIDEILLVLRKIRFSGPSLQIKAVSFIAGGTKFALWIIFTKIRCQRFSRKVRDCLVELQLARIWPALSKHCRWIQNCWEKIKLKLESYSPDCKYKKQIKSNILLLKETFGIFVNLSPIMISSLFLHKLVVQFIWNAGLIVIWSSGWHAKTRVEFVQRASSG
jgi:hypothetical protein